MTMHSLVTNKYNVFLRGVFRTIVDLFLRICHHSLMVRTTCEQVLFGCWVILSKAVVWH